MGQTVRGKGGGREGEVWAERAAKEGQRWRGGAAQLQAALIRVNTVGSRYYLMTRDWHPESHLRPKNYCLRWEDRKGRGGGGVSSGASTGGVSAGGLTRGSTRLVPRTRYVICKRRQRGWYNTICIDCFEGECLVRFILSAALHLCASQAESAVLPTDRL